MNDEPRRTLLDTLKALYPDSSTTTLRKMLQSGRVRVSGEVEKDAKRIVEAGGDIDGSQKNVEQKLPPPLALLFEEDAIFLVLKSPGVPPGGAENRQGKTTPA